MYNSNQQIRELIDDALHAHLPRGRSACNERLNEAVRYAIFPGGKRLRPILAVMAARLTRGRATRAVPAACALEFLHTSSLIFDDLPAMDDADERRGKRALHLVFGEDVALLAGLTLLNAAYGLFGKWPSLIAEAVECIGPDGMIGGQALDLEKRAVREKSDNRKTTALMRLTLTAGAIACGAHPDDVDALALCGERLGEAYQVCDDLLDQTLDREEAGKTVRQDSRHLRPSHALEHGADSCRERVSLLVDGARDVIFGHFGTGEDALALVSAIEGIVGGFRSAGMVMTA